MKSAQLILLSLSVLTISCSRDMEFKHLRRSQQELTSSLNSSRTPRSLENNSISFQSGSKEIVFNQQHIQGVRVEESFYKKIKSAEVEFETYNWIFDVPLSLRFEILWMQLQKPIAKQLFLFRNPNFRSYKKDISPELIIQDKKVWWKIVLEEKSGHLKGFLLSSQYEIKKEWILGLAFEQINAQLFPEGPIKSRLQQLSVPDLDGQKYLRTSKVKVLTQNPKVAYSEDSHFIFERNDPRFEQLQVYYYLSQVANWCESEFDFKFPVVLEVETSVGYPEKTNTAFYYQRKIRIGDGDGVTYSEIGLDPSIVAHEGFHFLIDAVARLPFQGEGASLNEGFADFLTALMLKNPRMGEVAYKKAPYKRSVQNELKLSDKRGQLYFDSGILSGLFWQIYQTMGYEKAKYLAWEVLIRMTPVSKFEDVKIELLSVASGLSAGDQQILQQVLQSRGWI